MLPDEVIKKIQRIEIFTNRVVNEVMAGQYQSVFKGRGVEFNEVREYQVGDEVRTIDWNVTARMGKPFVKQFVEERELTVMLMVDASASGRFGTVKQLKKDLAAQVCAVLAFSAIKNNDRVGMIIFTNRIERYIPPKKGRKHVLRVISEALTFQPSDKDGKKLVHANSKPRGIKALYHSIRQRLFIEPDEIKTDIAAALEFMNKILKRRAVVFLISDFFSPDYSKALQIANKKHDVICITLSDPRERELPNIGLVMLYDAETGEPMLIDTASEAVRKTVSAINLESQQNRDKLFRSLSLDSINFYTDKDFIPPLVQFFKARANKFR